MSYSPILLDGGVTGWHFLKRTAERQKAVFEKGHAMASDRAHLQKNAQKVSSVDELFSDRRLLRITLTAFGLEGDLSKSALIRQVIESDPNDRNSLANRLSDDRYVDLAKKLRPLVTGEALSSTTITSLLSEFNRQSFEAAIGGESESMRIALVGQRLLRELSDNMQSDRANWYTILGTPPLRKLFEGFLNLPSSFTNLDIVRQQEIIQNRVHRQLGISSFAELSDVDKQERIIEGFLLQEQLKEFDILGSHSIALAILQR